MKRITAILLAITFVTMPLTVGAENLFYFYSNKDGLKEFKKHAKDIGIFAPQIYEVGPDFKITMNVSKKIHREIEKKRVPTMPLLVQDNFDRALMTKILTSPEVQDSIIDFMLDEAKKYKYIGWQFDFENINHRDRNLYTAFVAKAGAEMKKNNLQFSVAVIVRNNDYNPNSAYQDWSSAYDYKNLASHVDFLSLMTYDDPRSVGPVASLPYVNAALDYLVKLVPAEKMSLGIPMYCWQWQNGVRMGATTYYLAKKNYKKGADRETGFDKALGAEFFSFIQGKAEMKIWCDNIDSIELKQKIVEDRGLRGMSAWALGQGDPRVWNVLGE